MNTFMPRMFVLACMALSFALSGCGPKEIEPYQTPTEESASKELPIAKTYPLYSSTGSTGSTITLEDEQGEISGSIEEEDMTSLGDDTISSEEVASLKADLPLPEDKDDNTPIVETLDAGSGVGEQTLSFDTSYNNKSSAYKEKHGRSSIHMKPVYFDFDQATIRNDQIPHLEHNAEYLKSKASSKVLIEGNCDELGTNEYNLALGERRAMNARSYLIKLGIAGSRIRTVSYGEERPLFTGSEESDYAYNRRDDFILE